MAKTKQSGARKAPRRKAESREKSREKLQTKMPPDVERFVRALQRTADKEHDVLFSLLEAMSESQEESRRRNEVVDRIYKKLGISEEIRELKAMAQVRQDRFEKALEKAGGARWLCELPLE